MAGKINFENPPVVEVVIGVQFARLAGFSTAHAGAFWQEHLRPDWPTLHDAPRLEDQFERFGADRQWSPLGGGITLRPATEPERVQIVDRTDERMIQIQDSRFVYNWRKQTDAPYPRYRTLLPEFEAQLDKFERFVEGAELGKVEPNQWEITYVNRIDPGDLWTTPAEWPKVIPGLYVPPGLQGGALDGIAGEWHIILPPDRGRLRITLRYARVGPTGPEVMFLHLLSRGPVNRGAVLTECLELGHEAIVSTFAAMTSTRAHEYWNKR